MTKLANKITATILGGAIGDALGVPVEFKARDTFKVTSMQGYGTHSQPPGTWSDDTSLTLCLMENHIENGNDEDLMNKFFAWEKDGYMTPHGICFDIGGTTHRAIMFFSNGKPPNQCGQASEYDNGNGSLMRIAPVAFLNINDDNFDTRAAKTSKYSKFTHSHPRSILGCIIYTEFLRQLFLGKDKNEALKITSDICLKGIKCNCCQKELIHYDRILNDNFIDTMRKDIKSGGYILDTLEAAIWCFLKNDNYKDTVLEAVNLGNDTDTTGIVAGSIAGMYYGLDDLPKDWIKTLEKSDFIKELCLKFGENVDANGIADGVGINYE